MQWHSVDQFFAMGGHAFYVWGSFGACALAMIVEAWLLRRRHRALVLSLKRERGAQRAPTRRVTVSMILESSR